MNTAKSNRNSGGSVAGLVVLALMVGGLLSFGWSSPAQAVGPAPTAPRRSSPARSGQAGATPNAPILLILNPAASNPFSGYLAEILKSEGLNAFDTVSLDNLTASDLQLHDVAILAETPLSATQAAMLTSYVTGGGRLVAMRPDAKIAALFGLGAKTGEIGNAYLSIDMAAVLDDGTSARGLPTVPLQIHGACDVYPMQTGAIPLARLLTAPGIATTNPAVVGFTTGTGIGVAFTYDLARDIVLTRQGDPARGVDATHIEDLFRSQSGTPWLDLDAMRVPQADEHQRLFARVVSELAQDTKPLPQLWYFPTSAKSVMIATANADASPISYISAVTSSVAARGGNTTFFLAIGGLTSADIQGLAVAGHSTSPWVTASRIDSIYPSYTITSLLQGFDVQTAWYNLTVGFQPAKPVRTVGRAWAGWADAAQKAADNGYGLDLSFETAGPWLQRPNGTWARGYVNGSGRPMKFVSLTGSVLPVYQQSTGLVDEQLLGEISSSGEALDLASALNVSRQHIDDSVNTSYGAVIADTQVTSFTYSSSQSWLSGTLDYAKSRGLPLLTGHQWWTFNTTRDMARFNQIVWDNASGRLTFNLDVTETTGVSLTTLLPVLYKGHSLQQLLVDGVFVPLNVDNVKATNYVWLTVPAGPHTFGASYGTDTDIGNLSAGVKSSSPYLLYQPIQFNANVDAGSNVTYLWDFGDGAIGSGTTPRHAFLRYGSGGLFTVKVTATNATGARTATLQVKLNLPPISFIPLIQK